MLIALHLALGVLPLLAPPAAPEKPVWIVVTTPLLAPALEPLAEWRRAGGFEVVVSTQDVAATLAAAARAPDYLLLVGDCEPDREDEPWFVATKEKPLYRWMLTQRPTFAADPAWGDLDDDGIPDVPVGRLPVRTPQETAVVVAKILAFETRPFTADDLRINVWGGSPDYGPQLDRAATWTLLSSLQTGTPPWLDLWVISGDANHPLCGWPFDQTSQFTAQTRKGGLLSVLMGHANADLFHSMRFARASVDYTVDDVRDAFSEGLPGPPMIFFACDSGDFARPRPCMAESFLHLEAGPVAVIAASTNSHPLTNYFTSTSLLAVLGEDRDRLGDLWLEAQTRAARRKLNFLTLVPNQLKDVEGKLEPEIDVPKLQRDQLLMYALLGDPATRLRLPAGSLAGEAEEVDGGWRWDVEAPPGAGDAYVGFRPRQRAVLEAAAPVQAREAANRLLRAANAELGFTPHPFAATDDGWGGTVARPGVLRIIVETPDGPFVRVFELD